MRKLKYIDFMKDQHEESLNQKKNSPKTKLLQENQ
jgi:hypothetical protein